MILDLTVCLCVYNAEKYIVETLESLKKQTFKAFQLLILDDCSTDHTREVVKKYFEENPWTEPEVVNFPGNHGTAWIRNYALNHATTPLMMFFDADDIAKPDIVEKLYSTISADDSLIAVSCYCNYMDADGNVLKGGIYLGPTSKNSYTAMFRREYALKAGGYRQAEWFPKRKDGIRYEDMSEDVDLWGRMSDFYKEEKYIIVLPEVLFFCLKNHEVDVLVLEDYAKGILQQNTAQEIVDVARKYGIKTILDPNPKNAMILYGLSMMKPNRAEAMSMSGIRWQDRDEDGLKQAAAKIISTWAVENLVISLAGDGMALFGKDTSYIHIPTRAREVYDVSGAGDTVVATFALASASGCSPRQIIELGNFAAGIAVAKLGTATVSAEELKTTIAQAVRDSLQDSKKLDFKV